MGGILCTEQVCRGGQPFAGGVGQQGRTGLGSEGAGQLAQHRVADDHRRELSPGEDIAADREGVRCEVLDDALVEAAAYVLQEGSDGE